MQARSRWQLKPQDQPSTVLRHSGKVSTVLRHSGKVSTALTGVRKYRVRGDTEVPSTGGHGSTEYGGIRKWQFKQQRGVYIASSIAIQGAKGEYNTVPVCHCIFISPSVAKHSRAIDLTSL